MLRDESAKWSRAVHKTVEKLDVIVEKARGDNASRGFSEPTGPTLMTIFQAGQEAKGALTEENGKIYEDHRGILFQQEEFTMKLIATLAKLGMELYREELMNALAIEQEEVAAARDRDRADVDRLNAEIEARQVAIIQARAEAEQRVTVLKAQLVTTEERTLVYETALIDAQVTTAEKKLEIIDSIYQVLAAEQLVLVAENRRAETLTVLLAAENVVAEVKRAMIPLYNEKANARVKLATAITHEIPVQEAIVELGYDRIDLENRKEYAAHLLRLAENELELAKLGWTRANNVLTLTQAQSRRLLQEYGNTVQAEVLELKQLLDESKIDLRLSTSLAKTAIGIDGDVEVQTDELTNTTAELTAISAGLAARATSQAAAISSGKRTSSSTTSVQNLTRQISGG